MKINSIKNIKHVKSYLFTFYYVFNTTDDVINKYFALSLKLLFKVCLFNKFFELIDLNLNVILVFAKL